MADVESLTRAMASLTYAPDHLAAENDPGNPTRCVLRVLLVCCTWTCHFQKPGWLGEQLMSNIEEKILKLTLKESFHDANSRLISASNAKVWSELTLTVEHGIAYFESLSFPCDEPESSSELGDVLAVNSQVLVRDIQRIDSLVCLARNILVVDISNVEAVQNLAARQGFDHAVISLIHLCIRVTARGYDGEQVPTEGVRGQAVMRKYKALLVHCLQFLNNLCTCNEKRKLMLWVELFDGGVDSATFLPDDINRSPRDTAGKPVEEHTVVGAGAVSKIAVSSYHHFVNKEYSHMRQSMLSAGEQVSQQAVMARCQEKWLDMDPATRDIWITKYESDVTSRHFNASNLTADAGQDLREPISTSPPLRDSTTSSPVPHEASHDQPHWPPYLSDGEIRSFLPVTGDDASKPTAATEPDYRMIYTADYGAEVLKQGKDGLLKRLEPYEEPNVDSARADGTDPCAADGSVGQGSPGTDADVLAREDSEHSYEETGEEVKGILTDVPLILAPNEMDVLALMIMSGIVMPAQGRQGHGSTPEETTAIKNMHTVRCHLLLAQPNGRNLFRELLIFVAAWDLQEEDEYFRYMVNIMRAILSNALMPFSYHAFRENKDIISPAQAVIIKILTHIFRKRQRREKIVPEIPGTEPADPYPSRTDVHMVNFLLTEFRRNIVPQTCALIFLQGLVRQGNANPDDFPLNLWDMERMYEGVYQYLEFFAVMTDVPAWKEMMSDWELSRELITLLQELDEAIPKKRLETPSSRSSGVQQPSDISAPSTPTTTDPAGAKTTYPEPVHDEPPEDASEFEWRNLKKLAVLVLSSITWKSSKVQDQVRENGGLEVVLACTNFDGNNPYIREHAIMCLRFLTEGNERNRDFIRQLEAKQVIPNEILDSSGYETFLNSRGEVQLRRKAGMARHQAQHPTVRPSAQHESAQASEVAVPVDQKGEIDDIESRRRRPRSNSNSTHSAEQTGTQNKIDALNQWMKQSVKNIPAGAPNEPRGEGKPGLEG